MESDQPDAAERRRVIAVEGYRDVVPIGHGGLGDVYRARRESTGGEVAIKVLRDVSDGSVAWHRTRRELTALVALAGHGNVVQLFEVLDLPDGPALVMEFASGGSIADLLRSSGGLLTPSETVFVGRQTCAALVAAHDQGIVHRDVKPQNLLIDAYGQVKLCDFGVAALTRSDEFRTRTNALSLRYASPEDLDDEIDVGSSSDIYSLGATMLHLAHGAPPSVKERLAPWTPPPTDDPALAGLNEVLVACLQPEPTARPSASALLAQLDDLDRGLDDRRRALIVDPAPAAPAPAPAPALPPPPAGGIVRADAPSPSPVPPAPSPASPDAIPAMASEATGPAWLRSDGTTERREGRVPARPAPPPRPPAHRRRGRWVFAGAVVLAGLVALGTFVLWPDADDEASPTATTEPVPPTTVPAFALVDRPEGLDPIDSPEVVWPYGGEGECLVQVDGDEVLQPTSCDEPHDLQRFLVAELQEFDADEVFNRSVVRQTVGAACRAAFDAFVGTAYADSELDAPFTQPSRDTWESGDRRYQCFVGAPGARMTGDAAGSGR